jgi:hypothetical protein
VRRRRGIIWVIDSPLGHLAVADRGGALPRFLGKPVRLFYSVDEMLAALPPQPPPSALVFGYAKRAAVVSVILNPPDPSLDGIPVYLADGHEAWPYQQLPRDRVFTPFDSKALGYIQGLEWFRDQVLRAKK